MEKEKKFQMTAPDASAPLRVDGLPDALRLVAGMQMEIDLFSSFAEEVLLAVLTPDSEHYVLDGKYADCSAPHAEDAMDGLLKLLARYRSMVRFLEKNGISPDDVFGEISEKVLN